MNSEDITIVVFGGTGDLTKRKLVPAFSSLIAEGTITKNSIIVGIGRKNFDDDSYKQMLVDSTSKNQEKRYIGSANIKYVRNDSLEGVCPSKLKEVLQSIEPPGGNNRLYYLAISPKLMHNAIAEIKKADLHKSNKSTKIILEKPIGLDLESSKGIEKEVKEIFNENQIFRIDHYLGKEVIQDIKFLKLTNPFFENLLSNKLIDNIELILDEDLGVENRINSYNDFGAIKDIIQNHLLQVLSLILMDLPPKLTTENIREEKLRVLKQLQVLPPKNHLLGQYKSYAEEAKKFGITNSKTETFAKIILNCKSRRWDGMKIIVRTGKKLKEKYAQININFKPLSSFFEHNLPEIKNNCIEICIQPSEDIRISFNTKKANKNNESETAYFKLSRESGYSSNPSEGHTKLLQGIILEDQSLFVSSEESTAAWEVIDQIEKMRDKINFIFYEDYLDPEDQ